MNDARQQFEAIISGPPYERSVARFPDNHGVWPGQYREYFVQLAWDVYQDMKKKGSGKCIILTT